jgi:hypothetical protein
MLNEILQSGDIVQIKFSDVLNRIALNTSVVPKKRIYVTLAYQK